MVNACVEDDHVRLVLLQHLCERVKCVLVTVGEVHSLVALLYLRQVRAKEKGWVAVVLERFGVSEP